VDGEKYLEWVAELREDTETNLDSGYRHYPGADVVNAMKNIRQDIISRTVKTNEYQLPCYAANLSAVIYAGGDVYPCEILEENLGNLRDVDYDFKKIWFSERTEQVRRDIREGKCFCTFENFLTNSVLFTPKMLPKVALEWMKLKVRRQLGRFRANGNGKARTNGNGSAPAASS
jgi:MoaA/NifB/PqqE/SkfB family radical SAM enzyme